mmetsp:Transcript_31442/g.78087  ORF Transcript_31442/g.78087 Transcript_31442/m.78087 type:complete len:195 (-) Transcript_31442:158-742(-)
MGGPGVCADGRHSRFTTFADCWKERVTSEKRAAGVFDSACNTGAIDSYVHTQFATGRLRNSSTQHLGSTMGSTQGLRATGGSSGFGGASIRMRDNMLRDSLRGAGVGMDTGSSMGSMGTGGSLLAPKQRGRSQSQSRHELIMGINSLERRLVEERDDLIRLRGGVGELQHATLHPVMPRRILAQVGFHGSVGAV